jgi:hypothetical protein
MRAFLVLVALAALAAFAPAGIAAKKKCVHLKEHDGCKLKNAAFAGSTTGKGPTYGLILTTSDSAGVSVVSGAIKGTCSGGGEDTQTSYVPVLGEERFPKRLVVGKKYAKTSHIDRIEDTGSDNARLIVTETVKIDVLSAKRARVTITTNQSSHFERSDDPPRVCKGTGSEKLKRRY